MSDKFISELDAAGPLTGAEIVPVTQSGNTVRTTVADIQADPLAAAAAAQADADQGIADAAAAQADATTALANAAAANANANTRLLASAVSGFGATLIDDANAAAARTTLGAGATGASLFQAANSTTALTSLTFLRVATGAQAWPVYDKLAARLDAKDFGVVADGTTDDTAAINAALAHSEANGLGPVRLPAGTIKISSALLVDGNGNGLVGAGRGATILAPSNATGNCIEIGDGSSNPANITIAGLSIIPSVTRSAGYAITVDNGHMIRLTDFVLAGPHYNGLLLNGGALQFNYYLDNYEISTCSNIGIHIGASGMTQGIYLLHGIQSSCGTGIHVASVSGFYATSIDSVVCGHGILFFPDDGASQSVQFCFFVNCTMDSCTGTGSGWEFFNDGPIVDITLSSCWSASHGGNGMHFNNTNINGVLVVGSRIINNEQHGVQIDSGTKISFADSQIFCNSQAGSASYHGIAIGAGVTGWRVSDCDIGSGGKIAQIGSNLQGYGILIASGSSDHFNITGNDLRGNVTGSLSNGGSGTNISIANNRGYVTRKYGAGSIPNGASTVNVAHGLSSASSKITVIVTPTVDMAAAGLSRFWGGAVSGANFSASGNTTTASAMFFHWLAVAEGG